MLGNGSKDQMTQFHDISARCYISSLPPHFIQHMFAFLKMVMTSPARSTTTPSSGPTSRTPLAQLMVVIFMPTLHHVTAPPIGTAKALYCKTVSLSATSTSSLPML
ncbi:hypothetical protein AZE42_12077 [Rhizopogon vesiculosus]|uniref:Uncharacterized protein n=1 Tax=Rhizopogon vesiculosus TaxID=180088 RepID=A0A1J8Q8H1_9AGAM|nr:hypothetical protein AZE42_12077 [Rhizopogon vesiculosus]